MKMSEEDEAICRNVLAMSAARLWSVSRNDYLDAGIMEDLGNRRLEADMPPWLSETEAHHQRMAYQGLYGEDRPRD